MGTVPKLVVPLSTMAIMLAILPKVIIALQLSPLLITTLITQLPFAIISLVFAAFPANGAKLSITAEITLVSGSLYIY